MNDLEGQAEGLEFNSLCSGKPPGAFMGGSTRVTIKMALVVEKRRVGGHRGAARALLSLIRGTVQTGE